MPDPIQQKRLAELGHREPTRDDIASGAIKFLLMQWGYERTVCELGAAQASMDAVSGGQ